jgi:hypothetical protein
MNNPPKIIHLNCKINASVSTPYRYLIMIHARQYKWTIQTRWKKRYTIKDAKVNLSAD